MSGGDASLRPTLTSPARNGDSSTSAVAFDGDLYSAIASSIAQGEASRQTAASPLISGALAASVRQAASQPSEPVAQPYINGYTLEQAVRNTAQDSSTSSYQSKQYSTENGAPVLGRNGVTSRSSSAFRTEGPSSTDTRPRHSEYPLMTDSETEHAAPLTSNGPNKAYTQAYDDLDRSPSVSYVDPGVNLYEEQVRSHMMDYELPELTGSSAPLANIDNDRRTSRSLSSFKPPPRDFENAGVDSIMLQETFEAAVKSSFRDRAHTPPLSDGKDNTARKEASTPVVDQGWGISDQQTPYQSTPYDELDELDELDTTSPQRATPTASGSQSRFKESYTDSAGTVGLEANTTHNTLSKGKQRVTEDDTYFPKSSPPRTMQEAAPPIDFNDNEDSNVSRRNNKGKERARDTTPEMQNGITTPPTSARTISQSSNPRPAAPRRKYRGLERLKKAACLALDRSEAYLDIALEDDGETCWIRCVNWGDVPNDEDISANGNGDENVNSDTAQTRSRPGTSANGSQSVSSAVQRQHQQEIENATSIPGNSSRLSQNPITCDAEVLAELVDGDAEQDKWRVISMKHDHSTACEMVIKQIEVNEILERENVDIQAEDDPELAEDILAASYNNQANGMEEDEDPEPSQAIQASLDAARQINGDSHYSDAAFDDDAQPPPSFSTFEALESQPVAGPSGTRRAHVANEEDEEARNSPKVAHSVSDYHGHERSLEQNSPTLAISDTIQQPTEESSVAGPGLFRRICETLSTKKATPSGASGSSLTSDTNPMTSRLAPTVNPARAAIIAASADTSSSSRFAPTVNPARAAIIAASAGTSSSSRSDNNPIENPADTVRAAYAARAAKTQTASRSLSAASQSRRHTALRSAAPDLEQQWAESDQSDSSDSDIEFVGEKTTPPLIQVGESYKPNDLGKLAQKLSTLVNKGSEVVWTQKPGNAPRALACKYGPGFNQDTQAGITCTFRVATKFHNGKLKVETICAEHSPACMTNYGNAPPDVKPKISTKSTSLAARKTGSTASRRKLLESVDKRSSHTKSVDEHQYASTELPDLFPKPPFAETRDAQFGRAAQEREHVVASIPTTSRKGKNRQRGGASTPSTSRSKHTKAPPKPQEGRIYNSMHHFLNDVKAYSEAKSPAADLRRSDNHGSKGKGKTKAAKTLIMECGYPGCPFRIAGKSLQDAKGRDLEGFQVLSSVPKHSRECRHTERTKRRVRNTASKSASVVEIESSVQPSIGSNDDERFRPRKRKAGFSDSTNAPRGQKKARIVESEESDQSLPPPLSVIPPKRDVNHASSVGSLHRSNVQDELSNNIDRTGSLKSSPAETRTVPAEGAPLGLRSPTHGSRGGTPAPFVATQAVVKSDDDMEEFFASYRNIMQVEPQSPERLPGHVKLYTDQIFESRDEFVDAVLRHTEERNPGCRLAVANTDPARVRVYCMRADCPYSFNSVYEHGARRVPAVKVTANHRDHSATCLAYYKRVGQGEQRVHFDPPMVDQEIGDWHDFESAVQAHTDSVNPGCELKTTKSAEHLRVYCPHKDLGCKYSFRAKFDIAEIQEGRVKARTEHSEGCLEHHMRIAEEEAEEEEALNRSVAKKRMKTEESNNLPSANTSGNHQGPGPHPGDEFADEAAFRAAVEVHTQIVNPGSSLEMRKMKNNRQIQCRNYHTGCRYEFYAALHPPAEDGTRRVIVTDVTPDHHEMCIAELVLRGRRPAPDGEEPIRTRRSRASLAGLAGVAGQGSQSSQAGTSINGGTKVVARKSTQGQKQIPRSRLHDSDSDSDRPALRESNLLSHTSMSSLAPKITAAGGPARSARPPLIPPSQRVQGRPPLQPMDNAPSRPVKRTRFEDVVASSSSSSHGSMPSKPLPTHVASSTGDSGSAGPAANSYASARLVQVMQDHPQAANLLAELGYHTVADLVRIGVSVEDWPDLFQFLGGCSTESFRDEQNSRAGHLDPLERFLLHRRARLAFAEEAQGQFRSL